MWIACECGASLAVKWPKPTSRLTRQVRLQAAGGTRRQTSCMSSCSGQGFVSARGGDDVPRLNRVGGHASWPLLSTSASVTFEIAMRLTSIPRRRNNSIPPQALT